MFLAQAPALSDITHNEATLRALSHGGLSPCCSFFGYHCGDSRYPIHKPLIWSDCHQCVWNRHRKGEATLVIPIVRIFTYFQGSSGFYLLGEKSDDIRVSNGLQVFTTSKTILAQVNVGDLITLSGRAQEFRSSSAPDDLSTTEIESPTSIVVQSSHNTFPIIVLGKDRSPPTQQFSALDVGPDGLLSQPNDVSLVDTVNAELQPDEFGLDFWESLEGQIVTIPQPVATNFENEFGEFWVYGDWPVTGQNSRGGITITFGLFFRQSSNPGNILIYFRSRRTSRC